MSQTTLNVKPEHPWKLTPKDLVTDLLGALFTLLSTLAIVGFSPLKGKLGFALTLIVMAIVTATVMSWIRLDRKAAVNSSTTVLVYIAASFVIMALASVLYEIIRLGAPGFSLSIFTKDMSETASDMPLTEGGLLHAVIGTAYIVIFATLIATPIGILTALYIVEVKGRFAGTVRFFCAGDEWCAIYCGWLVYLCILDDSIRKFLLRNCWRLCFNGIDDSNCGKNSGGGFEVNPARSS